MDISRYFLLGRYKDINTPVHRLDPRLKLLFMLVLSLTLFGTAEPAIFAAAFGLFLIVLMLSKMSVLSLLRGVMPVFWLILVTFSLHVIVPPRDFNYGLLASCRLGIIFMWATLLTVTTRNMDIAKAVAWYTMPLKAAGVSPSRIAFTFSVSLRFFPIILDEAQNIINAQKLRREKLSVIRRTEAFCTAFMVRMMRKARGIEAAMMNRRIRIDRLDRNMDFSPDLALNAAALLVITSYIMLFIIVK